MLSITTPFALSLHDAQIRLLFSDIDSERGRTFSWTEGGDADRVVVGDFVTMRRGLSLGL